MGLIPAWYPNRHLDLAARLRGGDPARPLWAGVRD
jgi:hypothetical protein